MSSSSIVDEILEAMGFIIAGSPLLLMYVIGIIVAIRRYRRHPRVSSLALLALVGAVLLAVTTPIIYRLLPQAAPDLLSFSEIGIMNVYRILAFTHSCLDAGLMALLLCAIFGGRTQPSRVQGADGEFLPTDFFKSGR